MGWSLTLKKMVCGSDQYPIGFMRVMEHFAGLGHVSPASRARVCSLISSSLGLADIALNKGVRVTTSDRRSTERLVASLQAAPHQAMLSSDGARVMLILSQDSMVMGCPKRCMIMTASSNVLAVRVTFDAALFEGDTIFSGEMVKAVSSVGLTTRTLLIHDLLIMQGQNLVGNMAPCHRHAWALDVIARGHVPDPAFDDLRLYVKQACSSRDMNALLDLAHVLPYPSCSILLRASDRDGVVFMVPLPRPNNGKESKKALDPPQPHKSDLPRVQTSILVVQDKDIKSKAKSEDKTGACVAQMMEVRCTDLPDVYEVLTMKKPSASSSLPSSHSGGRWDTMCVPSLAASRHMHDAFCESRLTLSVRMMCSFNAAFGRWGPFTTSPEISFPPLDVA